MIEWMMMGAFLAALGLSVWKVYLLIPNKPLPDNDTNPLAIEELSNLMVRCIVELYETEQAATPELLYNRMVNHQSFDQDHYWRFNQNRLNQLLTHYYLNNPPASTPQHIYEAEHNVNEISV